MSEGALAAPPPKRSGHGVRAWLERLLTQVSRRLTALTRAGLHRWRSSIQLRTVSLTVLLALVSLVVVGSYSLTKIRDGLFEQRVDQILAESQRSTQAVQAQFDASTAKVPGDVLSLLQSAGNSLQVSCGSTGIFLLRSPGTPIVFPDLVFIRDLRELVTPELRNAVADSDVQQWQSVGIPSPDGSVVPGVLVGANVTPPVVGQFQLYLLYSLADQQATLVFIQRTIGLAGLILVGLIGLMTWLVTAQVVRPVQVAAQSAERYADGHLDERMPVSGTDEVGRLAASFNEMAASLQDQIERMEELSVAQRRFVSDVSHELRTPLTTVRMAADMLYEARGEFNRNAARATELLADQLDRFESLLADLLEISRFDAGAAQLDAEERDLRSVVTQAIDALVPLAQREGVWLRVNLPNTQCPANIDAGRVERIVRNLLANAIEHAEDKPVEIHVGADSVAVAVVVRDYGIGLTEEAAEHAFDRFWRADPARTRTIGGTGLGLAIALEDARLHGGKLEAFAAPGEGASFRLTLPRHSGVTVDQSPLDPSGMPVSVGLGSPVGVDSVAAGMGSVTVGADSVAAGAGSVAAEADSVGAGTGSVAVGADSAGAGAGSVAAGADSVGTAEENDSLGLGQGMIGIQPDGKPIALIDPGDPVVPQGPRTDWVPVPKDDGSDP